jgi:hypothetical protein
MYVLLTDETNNQPAKGITFFITGGLIFPAKAFLSLDAGIEAIRIRNGYTPTDVLKFDTSSRPKKVTLEQASTAKSQVVDLCLKLECRFIAVVVHHSLITKQKGGKFLWPIDALIAKFEYLLKEERARGLCFIDNLPLDGGQWKYLSEKFTKGLYLAPKGKYMPLSRIRLFAATCNNASHISSATDIVLGAFRYCVNQPHKPDVAKAILSKVARMMHHKMVDGKRVLREHGLLLRPKTIEVHEYQQDYDNLINDLSSLIE